VIRKSGCQFSDKIVLHKKSGQPVQRLGVVAQDA
jgi:hypothetical protein